MGQVNSKTAIVIKVGVGQAMVEQPEGLEGLLARVSRAGQDVEQPQDRRVWRTATLDVRCQRA